MKTAILAFLFLILTTSILGQVKIENPNLPSLTQFNFYPLEIGNYWEYEVVEYVNIDSVEKSYYSIKVAKDTILNNGLSYYKMIYKSIPDTATINVRFERIDSSTSLVYRYSFNDQNEYVIDSLSASVGDIFYGSRFCWFFNDYSKCKEVFFTEILNYYTEAKSFVCLGTLDSPEYYLAQNIGLYQIWTFGPSTNLMYAFVNGIEYGDPVTVRNEGSKLPLSFLLSQNYPNPFNPVTKIKYSIPAGTRDHVSVQLKVYDILGREITTLVNEEKPTGEYEAEFNGSILPSGIYFYQLKTESFVETKKMVLIK